MANRKWKLYLNQPQATHSIITHREKYKTKNEYTHTGEKQKYLDSHKTINTKYNHHSLDDTNPMEAMTGKDVVIVAGPSASGKTYLIRKLMKNKKSAFKDKLFRDLDINPSRKRARINVGTLIKSDINPILARKAEKDLIFVHFDLTGRNQLEKRRALLSIADTCKRIKVVTLNTSFDVWQKRMKKRIDTSSSKTPSGKALAIYNLSRYSRQLGKWRYQSIYRHWSALLSEIDLDTQLVVNDID